MPRWRPSGRARQVGTGGRGPHPPAPSLISRRNLGAGRTARTTVSASWTGGGGFCQFRRRRSASRSRLAWRSDVPWARPTADGARLVARTRREARAAAVLPTRPRARGLPRIPTWSSFSGIFRCPLASDLPLRGGEGDKAPSEDFDLPCDQIELFAWDLSQLPHPAFIVSSRLSPPLESLLISTFVNDAVVAQDR